MGLFTQTSRERTGSIDGINLFFGALIGANLGTLDGLALRDYGILIAMLAGTVTALRLVSVSERRFYALGALGVWIALLAILYLNPSLVPPGLAQGDVDRLAVTIMIWVGSVVTFELMPVKEPATAPATPPAEPPAPAG